MKLYWITVKINRFTGEKRVSVEFGRRLASTKTILKVARDPNRFFEVGVENSRHVVHASFQVDGVASSPASANYLSRPVTPAS
jgi:hypothetical protein